MACCDEDRPQLYDEVAQQMGEIHDLEFHLTTAKTYTGEQGSFELNAGAMPPPTTGFPVQATRTMGDMTKRNSGSFRSRSK